jgi:drug/metabolite transporter (DMT)-like permease
MSRRAWLVFCATSLIWGSSFLLIKVAVGDVSPVAVAFARTAKTRRRCSGPAQCS